MSKRWTTFRGTSRDHLFNTGTIEENPEDRWPAMLGPSIQSWRTNLVSSECSLVPNHPLLGLKKLQEQANWPQDKVIFL